MSSQNAKNVTLLVVGAHPDDAELGCGGLLAKLARNGHRVGIIDLTRGEMGTSGSAETRMTEANNAAKALGLDFRESLDLGDARLFDSPGNRLALGERFRFYRPQMVATSCRTDRHPDHSAAAALVKAASLTARLKKANIDHEPHSISRLFFFSMHDPVVPSFIVDISETFQAKKSALEAYQSQFLKPKVDPDYHYLGIQDYIRAFSAKAAYLGSLIGSDYAEGFIVEEPLRLDHPEEVLISKRSGGRTNDSENNEES